MKDLTPLKKQLGNLIALLLGCLFVALMCVGIELILRFRAHSFSSPPPIEKERLNWGACLMDLDPIQGFRLKKNITTEDFFKINGVDMFRAVYSTNSSGYRITPVEKPESRPNTALFLGCSFAFGCCVGQNETLPVYFGENTKTFIPINAGCPGWGPQNIWLQMHEPLFWNIMPTKKGIVCFVYINDHFPRLVGGDEILLTREIPLPWIELDNGHLVHRGNFRDRSPLFYSILRVNLHFHIERFLQKRIISYYPRYIPSEQEEETLMIAVMKECSYMVHTHCPEMKFCFMVWPLSQISDSFKHALEELDISCFDYNDLIGNTPENDTKYWYFDTINETRGHPRGSLHKLVAEQFARDLAARFPEYTKAPTP